MVSVSASAGLKPQLRYVYVYDSPPVTFAHNVYLHHHSSSLNTLASTQSSSPTPGVMVIQHCSPFTTIHHHLPIHCQTACPPHPITLTQHRTTHHNITISSTTSYPPSLIPLAASLLLESKHSSHLASGSIVIWYEVDSNSRRTGTSRDSASPDSAGQGGHLLFPRGCPWFTLIIRFVAWVHS